jgi:hypothetical protein
VKRVVGGGSGRIKNAGIIPFAPYRCEWVALCAIRANRPTIEDRGGQDGQQGAGRKVGEAGAAEVLAKAAAPLKSDEITRRVLEVKGVRLVGKTSAASVAALLATENTKPDGLFVRTAPGTYAREAGVQSESAFLAEVGAGAYDLVPFDHGDVVEAVAVIRRRPELGIGLTDASLVVLAERFGTTDVLTLDERHFRVLRTRRGKPFRILPADA